MAQPSSRTEGDYLHTGSPRHVESLFMKDSLLSDATKKRSEVSVYPLMPDVKAIQIGGKLIDGGKKTLYPILEEIRSNIGNHKLIIAASSGQRARHVLAVGEDLGLPVGVLAELKRLDTELNAHMIGALLSPYGIAELTHAEMVHMLPAMLEISRAVVFNGVPPYDLWEHPPESGFGPPTGADVGVFLFALTCGMKSVIYVRDVDGIFTSDPTGDSAALLIPRTRPKALLDSGPRTLSVDREVFELQASARHQIAVRVVNGTKTGMITSALKGDDVGTTVE